MAICQAIVNAHDGRLWVESTPGEGANFYHRISPGNRERKLEFSLKQYHRITNRCEKQATNYAALLTIAVAVLWLKSATTPPV